MKEKKIKTKKNKEWGIGIIKIKPGPGETREDIEKKQREFDKLFAK